MDRRRALVRGVLAVTGTAFGTDTGIVSREARGAPGKSAAGEGARGQFIAARDGTRLFYRDFGTGHPILFVAPWALGCDWWEYQTADLVARGMRCIAYDRRGQDRSGQPGHGYDFNTLADDLGAVLETLDLRQVTLVGHSMGSAEGVRYLSRHGPGRVARLILVAPITPFILKTDTNPDGLDPQLLSKVRAALGTDRAGAIAGAAPAFFGIPANPVSPEMMQWWAQMLLRCPLHLMLDLHRSFTETDFTPDLARISLPTLIIHGDRDLSAPIDLTGRRTARQIRGSRLEVYEGAAHGLPITHMSRLNEDIFRFAQAGM